MRFGRFADIVAGADEETRGRVHHLLSVLQRTGGMIGDGEPAPVTGRKIDVVQEFADVLRHCRKPRRLFGMEGVVAQHEAILLRSEQHTSELQSLMRISYAVFCLKKKQTHTIKV